MDEWIALNSKKPRSCKWSNWPMPSPLYCSSVGVEMAYPLLRLKQAIQQSSHTTKRKDKRSRLYSTNNWLGGDPANCCNCSKPLNAVLTKQLILNSQFYQNWECKVRHQFVFCILTCFVKGSRRKYMHPLSVQFQSVWLKTNNNNNKQTNKQKQKTRLFSKKTIFHNIINKNMCSLCLITATKQHTAC